MLAQLIGGGVIRSPSGGGGIGNTAVVVAVTVEGDGQWVFAFDRTVSASTFVEFPGRIEMKTDLGVDGVWVPVDAAFEYAGNLLVEIVPSPTDPVSEWRILTDPGIEFDGGAITQTPQNGFVSL